MTKVARRFAQSPPNAVLHAKNLDPSSTDEGATDPELRGMISKMEYDATQSIYAILEGIRMITIKPFNAAPDDIDGVMESVSNGISNARAVQAAVDRIHSNASRYAKSVIDSAQQVGINNLQDIVKVVPYKSMKPEAN